MSAAEERQPTILELWQRHVLECPHCGRAATGDELCAMGKNFWRVPGTAAMPSPAPLAPPAPMFAPSQAPMQMTVQVNPPVPPAPQPSTPQVDLSLLADRVAEKVIARTSSGAAVAIPMEKTSKLVEFSTAPGVTLRMPERDIEIYGAMRGTIQRCLRYAERVGTYMLASEESRRIGRDAGVILNESQVALVVRKVAEKRGAGPISAESLYDEFVEMTGIVIKMADVIGRFMGIDADTRHVMRECREVGAEMQSQIERAAGSRLVFDQEMRDVVRKLRLLAISFQSEMDRRLGT